MEALLSFSKKIHTNLTFSITFLFTVVSLCTMSYFPISLPHGVRRLDSQLPFVVGLMTAISVKIMASVEDIVWLSPFLTGNDQSQKVKNCLVYTAVSMLQTAIAVLISLSGNKTVEWIQRESSTKWSSEKILTLISGVNLLLFSIPLAQEYYHEMFDDSDSDTSSSSDDDDQEAGKLGSITHQTILPKTQQEMELLSIKGDSITGIGGNKLDKTSAPGYSSISSVDIPTHKEKAENTTSDQTSPKVKKKAKTSDRSPGKLFFVAFLGSLDDLTMFVPLLVGKALTLLELVAGTIIATVFVVLLCTVLAQFKYIAKCLEAIPLCAIIFGFGCYLLLKGWFLT